MKHYLSTLLLSIALCLPGLSMAETEYWEYTFRPGDSIWNIAKKYTTSVNNWYEIQRINEIRQGKDKKIRPGTRIVIPVSMLKLKPAPAIVIARSEGVKMIRKDGSEHEIFLKMKLFTGDKVITSDKQRVRLQFADESELQILANSEVVLDQISHHRDTGMVDTRIRLNIGSVNTKVTKQKADSHYEIWTPAAVTAVRGTQFRVSSDQAQISRTEVGEGLVNVSAGETEKDVKEKYGIIAEKDKPLSEPVKLLEEPKITLNVKKSDREVLARWDRLPDADYYLYELARDEGFNEIVAEESTRETTLKLASIESGAHYFRVRGVHKNKLQGLNGVSTFDMPKDEGFPWPVLTVIGIILLSL